MKLPELLDAVWITGFIVGLVAVAVCGWPVIVWHLSGIGKGSAKRGGRDFAVLYAKMQQERRNDLWWRRGREAEGLRGL